MSLLKYVLLGAAAVYGAKYLTKKREIDGKSILDDLKEKAPDISGQVKQFGDRIKRDYNQTSELY